MENSQYMWYSTDHTLLEQHSTNIRSIKLVQKLLDEMRPSVHVHGLEQFGMGSS